MERTSVESTNISQIGYNAKNQVLGIIFKHGGEYHYNGVALDAYESLISADSYGKYFINNIKDDYSYTKI